jgi:hypothetical protein
MPAPKPATMPRWATVDGINPATNVSAPPSAKQDTGFPAGDPVPSALLNWFLFWIYLWIEYLNDLASEAFTWTGLHVFSALVTMNGAAGDTNGARKTSDAPTARKLIDSWNLGGATPVYARWYAVLGGGVELTINAAWGGATWTADDTARAADKSLFQESAGTNDYPRQRFFQKGDPSGGAWADNAWDTIDTPIITAGAGTLSNLNVTRSGEVVAIEVYIGYTGASGTPTLFTLGSGWARPKHDVLIPVTRFNGSVYDTVYLAIESTTGYVNALTTINTGETLYLSHAYVGG